MLYRKLAYKRVCYFTYIATMYISFWYFRYISHSWTVIKIHVTNSNLKTKCSYGIHIQVLKPIYIGFLMVTSTNAACSRKWTKHDVQTDYSEKWLMCLNNLFTTENLQIQQLSATHTYCICLSHKRSLVMSSSWWYSEKNTPEKSLA